MYSASPFFKRLLFKFRSASFGLRLHIPRPILLTATLLVASMVQVKKLLQQEQYSQLLLAKAPPKQAEPPQKPQEITQVTEPATGIIFPSHLPALPKLRFVGCGCRKKYGIAKVYAVGIYVDNKPAGSTPNEIADNLISDSSLIRAICLKMYREVRPETMVEALESSLKPRLEADPSKPPSAEALQSLAQMKTILLSLFGSKIKVGTEILFILDPGTTPTVLLTVSGQPPQKLVNAPALRRALLNCYLSKTAVVPELRANVGKEASKL